MTARAAGSGGTPEEDAMRRALDPKRKHQPALRRPPSRSDKLARARAAGRSGRPAPAWIDDAELLAAYDAGASELGSSWAGDVESPTASSTTSTGDAAESTAPAAEPLPMRGSLFPATRTLSPQRVRTSGPAGDAAGAFLGFIATAFAINVIRGTSGAWLRAKFLNQVSGTPRPDPNAAPGLFSTPTPTPTSYGQTGGVPQGVPFGGAQAAQSQAGAVQTPPPFGGATATGSQANTAALLGSLNAEQIVTA